MIRGVVEAWPHSQTQLTISDFISPARNRHNNMPVTDEITGGIGCSGQPVEWLWANVADVFSMERVLPPTRQKPYTRRKATL